MTVAFDSASSTGPSSSVSSINWAHTLGGGSNLVAVGFACAGGGTVQTVSSFKYGTQAMTQVPSARELTANGNSWIDLWYLIGPTGNQTVTLTLTAAQSVMAGGLIVVSGADQTSPLETAAVGATTGAALTINATSAANELVLGGGFDDFNASGWTWAVSTGTSEFTVGSGSGQIGLVGGIQTGGSPTATMAFTESGGANNSAKAGSLVSIKVFSGGAAAVILVPARTLRGAGI